MTATDLSSLLIRPLRRPELDQVLDWAAAEGWNPGLDDADAFWATDPEGFIGIERAGELVGSGAIVSYEGRFGFMGLFIVRPDLRGQGIGRRLWQHRRDRLLERLHPGEAIGLDGVFEMERFYADGGFRLAHRHLRMRCIARDLPVDSGLEQLSELPFSDVAAFDRSHLGAPREDFLRRWVAPAKWLGLGLREDGRLRGIGVARACRDGYKIGPLFAEDEDVADRILRSLNGAGAPLYLDVPECNPAAMTLARRYDMEEVLAAPACTWGSRRTSRGNTSSA